MDAVGPHHPDGSKAVELRHHAVHHHHVMQPLVGQRHALRPVPRVIGDMTGLGQPLDQPGRQFAIILDNQNAHEGSLKSQSSMALGSNNA